jgi:3-deoxy-D-manno-octulosonic-acid transferase
VSVGETRAAAPLVGALQRRYPGHRILLTHMTPTGRAAGAALFGSGVDQCYLPYDFPFAIAGFLDHFRPVCGILLETEIWPNLIQACAQRAIPLYLVNARLSDKSFRRYRRFGTLTAAALRGLTAIAAQGADDTARFRELGAAAVVTAGNLKFDGAPDVALAALGAAWRAQYGAARPVLLWASTREGEEALLLDALAEVDAAGWLVVIVPRHPQRFGEVAALLEGRAIPFQRRSAAQAVAPDTRVLLGDSMGEMDAYYAACDVAVIGGSFLPFGAHNLIEACALGKPVVVGPHDYNFAEAVRLAVAAGAAVQVGSPREALAVARTLLGDAIRLQAMAEAGRAFVRGHAGSTQRILDLVKPAA